MTLTPDCLNGIGKMVLVTGFMVWVFLTIVMLAAIVMLVRWTVNFIGMSIALATLAIKHPLSVKDGYSKIAAVIGYAARQASTGYLDLHPRREPVKLVYKHIFNWKIVKLTENDDGTSD